MPQGRQWGAQSPFVEHITATLEDRIRTGAYRTGRWLPTERELCTEFAVSRATLRHALVALEHNKLLVRAAGCRPFVRSDVELAPEVYAQRHETTRRSIGLCVKHDPKYSGTYQIIQGARNTANTDSIRLIVAGPSGSTYPYIVQEEARTLLRMVQGEDISGIVIWYCGGDDNIPILETVQRAGIPLVFVDRAPPASIDADLVTIDNRSAARGAVQYLIERGHERIAHVTNPERVSTVAERRTGYIEALETAGLTPDNGLIFTACRTGMREAGQEPSQIASTLILMANPPTAVFAVTDYIALAIVGAL